MLFVATDKAEWGTNGSSLQTGQMINLMTINVLKTAVLQQ